MKSTFNTTATEEYKSNAQRARILTESWVKKEIYCPNCGQDRIDKYPNNQPVADFYCANCREDYELKSKQNCLGVKIVNGAYRTMIERLTSSNNPNLFLLNYDLLSLSIINFLVIPKHYFVPIIIEKRKPLTQTARRAGWVGCNILLKDIPQSGKIFYIRNQQTEPKEKVLSEWKKTLFLREEKEITAKGWLLDIMRCIDGLGRPEFTLLDMYVFENKFRRIHPENKHIKDKIRQQLQILRDKGYVDFVSRGYYRLV